MILNKKWSGRIKGRLAYNGKATFEWITKEDKSSPTVLTESIKITVEMDAYEEQDVASMDIPNAFIQEILPPRPAEERVIMNIGKLVDWLLEIDPTEYTSLIVIERVVKVLYLYILRTIYGMLQASLLWYHKFRKDLEKIGFDFNVYDPCVANRKINNKNIPFLFMWMISYRATLTQKSKQSLENGRIKCTVSYSLLKFTEERCMNSLV